jgi:hypothetical protein
MESLLPAINKLQDVFNALGSDPLGASLLLLVELVAWLVAMCRRSFCQRLEWCLQHITSLCMVLVLFASRSGGVAMFASPAPTAWCERPASALFFVACCLFLVVVQPPCHRQRPDCVCVVCCAHTFANRSAPDCGRGLAVQRQVVGAGEHCGPRLSAARCWYRHASPAHSAAAQPSQGSRLVDGWWGPVDRWLPQESASSKGYEEWGEFLHKPGQLLYDFAAIKKEIEDETDRSTGKNKVMEP